MLLISAAVALAAASACGGGWTAEGARILAVETMGGRSHWNFMSGVIRALVDRGHHVTALTPFPGDDAGAPSSSRGNYTEVDISDAVPRTRDAALEHMMRLWGSSPAAAVGGYVALSRRRCDSVYAHPEAARLLGRAGRRPAAAAAGPSPPPPFDAVLVEPLLSECVSHAARLARSPLVYVVPMAVASAMLRPGTGHFPNAAVVSHVMAGHAAPDTFARRLTNALLSASWEAARAYHDAALGRADPRDYDRAGPVRPSLVFVNGHFASGAPSAVPAQLVNVGGVHLKPAAPLSQNLLEFIEQSPHGVICFTLGSTVKMSTLPEHLLKTFMDALAQVPQRVLLKYEDDMKEKPKNVMTVKWLPQRDILVHPNVKLFISHGGISGLYEAVDAGVPVLGFPLFSDQHRNIDSLVNTGMAISMDLSSVTTDVFLKNILELLNNKKFMINAKSASEVFKDRPLSPAEEVVYWTEYVIRHKGAPHLKSPAINLTWYQYYLLDVIAVVLIFISVVFFIIYKLLKSIINYILNCVLSVKNKRE